MSGINPNYRITIMQSSGVGIATTGNAAIIVEAPMPETFAFDAQASYATMLPQGLTGGAMATALAAVGIRLAVPALTAQLWQGSSEIQLQLALEFHTESDPVADVQLPILNLNRLTMPSINSSSGMLQAPGPSLDFTTLSSIISNAKTQLANTYSNAKNSQVTPTPSTMNNTSLVCNSGNSSAMPPPTAQNPTLGTSQYWKSKISNQISIRIGSYMYFDSVVITQVQQTFMSNIDAITGLPHHATVNITFKPLFMLTVEDLAQVFISNSAPGQSGGGALPTTNSLGASIASAGTGLVSSAVRSGLSAVGTTLTNLMPGTAFAYVPPQYR